MTRVTVTRGLNRETRDPSLSANGTKIAFYSDADFLGQGIPDNQFEIWLYDTTTMTLTRITTASSSYRGSFLPSLNADGTKIAFLSFSDFLGQGIPSFQQEIWLYDTATMTFTRITTASDNSRGSFYPSLNADGTKIAFRSDSDFLGQGIPDDQYEIWLYDTTTMTLTRITIASDSTRDHSPPSLSADGTKNAFVSDSDFLGQGIPDDQYEIWLYDTTTMTLTRITTASDSTRDSFTPSLNANGTKVAFSSDSDFLGQGIPDNQSEIWLYATTTMTLTRITTASDSTRVSGSPSLSADGTKNAFVSDSDFLGQGIPYEQFEIWLYDTTTMTFTRLTTASSSVRQSLVPSLSADGAKVAFLSDSDFLGQGIRDDQYEIWLYRNLAFSIYLPVVLKNIP